MTLILVFVCSVNFERRTSESFLCLLLDYLLTQCLSHQFCVLLFLQFVLFSIPGELLLQNDWLFLLHVLNLLLVRVVRNLLSTNLSVKHTFCLTHCVLLPHLRFLVGFRGSKALSFTKLLAELLEVFCPFLGLHFFLPNLFVFTLAFLHQELLLNLKISVLIIQVFQQLCFFVPKLVYHLDLMFKSFPGNLHT